jgi:hypothetical protein
MSANPYDPQERPLTPGEVPADDHGVDDEALFMEAARGMVRRRADRGDVVGTMLWSYIAEGEATAPLSDMEDDKGSRCADSS